MKERQSRKERGKGQGGERGARTVAALQEAAGNSKSKEHQIEIKTPKTKLKFVSTLLGNFPYLLL